ncbi:MAG: hypothetical protein ACTSX6_13935 [Candidatus Heimdallarchaeaceae archaeon]
MTDITKKQGTEETFFSKVFSPKSKYLSWFELVTFFFLFFLIEFFLIAGLESAFYKIEDFFETISSAIMWLILIIIPLILSLIIFAFAFHKPKTKFIAFIYSITGLFGIVIGFGIMTALYNKVLPNNKYIDIIAFSIILGSCLIFSSIFTVITIKKIN